MKILIVDDERAQREILQDILKDAGYSVLIAEDGDAAIDLMLSNHFGIILTDLKMPGKDGLDVLHEALAQKPAPQVIIMTAFGSIPGAVTAIKKGAYDYLAKPFQKDDLLRVVSRAAEKWALLEENEMLRKEIEEKHTYGEIIGKSRSMRYVFDLIDRIKDIDATCLITGESGTGKELVARAVHFQGIRKSGPFVAINCGAIPENLIESELFGHVKGAFTGAVDNRTGSFLKANGGTLFLDEIGTMKADLQVKLLRVIQEKALTPVGASKEIAFDVRIIAATNTDLEEAVRAGSFRMDLYHRLNVFSIKLPSLKSREGDIPLLLNHFLEKYCLRYGKPVPQLTGEVLEKLEHYSFPGNVRELENLVERLVIMMDLNVIQERDIDFIVKGKNIPDRPPNLAQTSLPGFERKLIENALEEASGSIKIASTQLGISYKTLQYRIKKFNINKDRFKKKPG